MSKTGGGDGQIAFAEVGRMTVEYSGVPCRRWKASVHLKSLDLISHESQ